MSRIIFKTTVSAPDIDIKKYRAKINTYMEEEQRKAIIRWLVNVLKHTPTYTGTARGTYAPVGRVVGRYVRMGHIRGNPKQARQKKYFRHGGQKLPLGFAAGANYSEHKIARKAAADGTNYIFEFDQRLPYVLWNESSPAPPWMQLPSNPPWFALKSAGNAYRRYANGPIRRNFPLLKKYIKVKTIKT